MKAKTWYTVKDGKIDRVQVTRENERPQPENLDWKESLIQAINAEESFDRFIFAEDGKIERRKTNEEYLEGQEREDPRGRWYHKGREKQEVHIYDIDSTGPGDEYTQEPPLENELYQKFDEAAKRWVVDTEKKELAEKQNELGRLKAEIEQAERKQYRSMKAVTRGLATTADTDKFNEYETIIENLRPQVAALEEELQSA